MTPPMTPRASEMVEPEGYREINHRFRIEDESLSLGSRLNQSALAIRALVDRLAAVEALHKHDRQMWDATRRRAEQAEARALTAEAALAKAVEDERNAKLDVAGTWKAVLHVFGPDGCAKVGEFFPEARQYVVDLRARATTQEQGS